MLVSLSGKQPCKQGTTQHCVLLTEPWMKEESSHRGMNFGASLGGMNVLLAVNVASLERGGWQNLPPGRICDCQKFDETRQRLQ